MPRRAADSDGAEAIWGSGLFARIADAVGFGVLFALVAPGVWALAAVLLGAGGMWLTGELELTFDASSFAFTGAFLLTSLLVAYLFGGGAALVAGAILGLVTSRAHRGVLILSLGGALGCCAAVLAAVSLGHRTEEPLNWVDLGATGLCGVVAGLVAADLARRIRATRGR